MTWVQTLRFNRIPGWTIFKKVRRPPLFSEVTMYLAILLPSIFYSVIFSKYPPPPALKKNKNRRIEFKCLKKTRTNNYAIYYIISF